MGLGWGELWQTQLVGSVNMHRQVQWCYCIQWAIRAVSVCESQQSCNA